MTDRVALEYGELIGERCFTKLAMLLPHGSLGVHTLLIELVWQVYRACVDGCRSCITLAGLQSKLASHVRKETFSLGRRINLINLMFNSPDV